MSDDSNDALQVQRRVVATSAVGSIVQAIWALASAELPRVDALAEQASVYLDWVDAVLERLAGPEVLRAHHTTLCVVLGPERSFCGGFPRQVAQAIPHDGAVALVGLRLAEAGSPDVRARAEFVVSGPGSVDELEPVADAVAAAILSAAAGRRVELLYPSEGGAFRRAVLLSAPRELPAHGEVDTYSDPSLVLAAAVAESVTGRLRVALAETLRTEVRARAAAAESARNAVDEQLEDLESRLRVIFQEQITSELVDLYAGVLAQPVADRP